MKTRVESDIIWKFFCDIYAMYGDYNNHNSEYYQSEYYVLIIRQDNG
jgi:hypothetical protein